MADTSEKRETVFTLTLQPSRVGMDVGAIIRAITKIEGIGDAGLISENAKDHDKDVAAWATVKPEADLSSTQEKLEAVVGVESAGPFRKMYA